MAYNETPMKGNAVLTIVAMVLTALVTWILCRVMRRHVIADLKSLHKQEIEVVKAKWFSDGWEDGQKWLQNLAELQKAPYTKP